MTKFEKGYLSPEQQDQAKCDEVWLNDKYQVFVYNNIPAPGWGASLIWLSIKRRDKEVIHDWRELQQIKNELVGEENEAVELYPAESRLVDESNQYHLWVLSDSTIKFPFGWKDRNISTPEEAEKIGAKQRPF